MTFKEAFESGFRFKLPSCYDEDFKATLWDEIYWVKVDKGCLVISTGEVFNPDNPPSWFVDDDLHRDDWYLHPKDVHNYNFRTKVESIINDA